MKPFLKVDAAALAALQAEYHRRSRLYHPDRFLNASDEERAQAEAKSAELNADYARLRDPLKLVDCVLSGSDGDTPAPTPAARASAAAPPPELAEEYFELQEAWMEAAPGAPESKRAAENFLGSVQSFGASAQRELTNTTDRFPFQGSGEGPLPWTQEDLEMLRKAVHKLRYSASFERDIRAKFLGG